ncbi:MAG: type II secretion system F family protein [Chloroflexi bacterium]|nr:type II secretion system F family protein [Chloroflexota bacterium]
MCGEGERKLWRWAPVAALLLALTLLVGCFASYEATSFHLQTWLDTGHLPEGPQGLIFRVRAKVTTSAGELCQGFAVMAQIWDAEGRSIGNLVCAPIPGQPGYYGSPAFVPPVTAKPGMWQVEVTATKGRASLSRSTLFQVLEANRWMADRSALSIDPLDPLSEVVEGSTARNAQPNTEPADEVLMPRPLGLVYSVLAKTRFLQILLGSRVSSTALGSLISAFLVMVAVTTGFVGVWRIARPLDAIEQRVQEYGIDEVSPNRVGQWSGRGIWSRLSRFITRYTMGEYLAEELAQADLPLTVAEFVVLLLGVAALGALIGAWRLGTIGALALGALFGFIPIWYIKRSKKDRQQRFTQQLPDILTLMVGALRAGYGLTQSLQVLVDQLPPPACTEFARVMRAVSLGVSVPEALSRMATRIGTDDVGLVVTAINVQYEMGGNLAETLDIIGETIRDRITIQREIQVLTSEERLTGYILAGLPAVVGGVMFVINPGFIMRFLDPTAPPWVKFLPLLALFMQFIGLLVIRKIIDIEL